MAVDATTTSAPSICSAVCPGNTRTPRLLRWRVVALCAWSEPDTLKPKLCSTSAMPHMPEPPMPTKWMFLTLFFMVICFRVGVRKKRAYFKVC